MDLQCRELQKMLDEIPTALDSALRKSGFSRHGKRNWSRQSHDVLQLINLQKSQYSDDEYINVALWPQIFGTPEKLSEHKFPLRGRLESVLGEEGAQGADWPRRLLAFLDDQFSSFESLRISYRSGALDSMYITGDLRDELERNRSCPE